MNIIFLFVNLLTKLFHLLRESSLSSNFTQSLHNTLTLQACQPARRRTSKPNICNTINESFNQNNDRILMKPDKATVSNFMLKISSLKGFLKVFFTAKYLISYILLWTQHCVTYKAVLMLNSLVILSCEKYKLK